MTSRISRGQHAHQTALANDPTKDISANQWNDGASPAHIETGIIGYPTSTSFVQLSSNQLIPVDTFTVVKASSGTSDTLNFIATNLTNANDIIFLAPFSGHTITVANNASSPPTNYGAVVILSGANKVLDANVPTCLIRIGSTFYEYALNAGITNANISSSAAIVYGKLNLTGSILNSDIGSSAAIAYNKLNLATSVVNADISTSAAIAYSKLNLATSILNSDISTTAGIRISKLATGNGDLLLDTNGNNWLKGVVVASAVNYIGISNNSTNNNPIISSVGTDSNIGCVFTPKGSGEFIGTSETLVFPVGAESGNQTAGTYLTYYAPNAGEIVSVYQCCTVAPTTSAVTLDIAQNGTSIFSTKPTIAATAHTGTNGVLTSTPLSVAQGDKFEFKVSTNDTGATSAGIKLIVRFYRTS